MKNIIFSADNAEQILCGRHNVWCIGIFFIVISFVIFPDLGYIYHLHVNNNVIQLLNNIYRHLLSTLVKKLCYLQHIKLFDN